MECKLVECKGGCGTLRGDIKKYHAEIKRLNAINARLEKQELGGARITIDHQIDPELQKEIGVSPVENDNIQLVVCRLASFCQTAHIKLTDRQAKLDALVETLEEMKTSYGQFVEMVEALKSKEGEK